jgi:hypothetical protein
VQTIASFPLQRIVSHRELYPTAVRRIKPYNRYTLIQPLFAEDIPPWCPKCYLKPQEILALHILEEHGNVSGPTLQGKRKHQHAARFGHPEPDRPFSLAIDVIDRVPALEVAGAHAKEILRNMQIACQNYAHEHGVDKPEVDQCADWLEELAVYGMPRRFYDAETAHHLSQAIKHLYLVKLATDRRRASQLSVSANASGC